MKKLLIVAALAVVAGAQVHAEMYKEIRKQEGCGLSDTGAECGKTVVEGRCAQTLKGEVFPAKCYSKTVTFTCPEQNCCDKTCPACPPCVCPVCPRVECKAELIESCPTKQICGSCKRNPCGCKARHNRVNARQYNHNQDVIVETVEVN